MQFSAEDLLAIKGSDNALYESILEKYADKVELEEPLEITRGLFKKQQAFFNDTSKRKAALCGRRAGKTTVLAMWLLEGARDDDDGLSVYICLSRNQARLILWATLQAMNRKYKLGLKFKERDNQLTVTTANNHTVWLVGCSTAVEIEKFRGLKLRRAAIDEAASFPAYIKSLVVDILEPALMDLDGEIAMIGTPGVVPAGLFFELTTGEGTGDDVMSQWSVHSWTVLDNTYLPHAEKWLKEKRKQNRWDLNHPRYVREYLGKWVRDEGALCYPFDVQRNYYYMLPEGPEKWTYAIGVDIGYEDSTSFVVGAFRRNHPEIYIIYADKKVHLIPSAVAAELQKLKKRFGAHQIIMDTGGIGKGYAEECTQRYGIYIEPAKKTEKRAYMEIVRGEIISGTIKVHPIHAQCLLTECGALVWDEKMEGPDERFECHAADGMLYLVRALMPNYRPQREPEALTEAQQANAEASKHKQWVIEQQRLKLRRKMKSGGLMRDIAMGA